MKPTLIRTLFALAVSLAPALAAADGFVDMFNGKDLAGWKTTGNWLVEDGNVITLKPRQGESGWQRYDAYLTTERKYGDFILDLEFKFGNPRINNTYLR
jgi:hypothetical protein